MRLIHGLVLRKMGYFAVVFLLALTLGGTLGLIRAEAQSEKADSVFYKGKSVDLIVPYSPGGGYDSFARLVAPFIEKYLGAKIVVKNMTEAGGLMGINKVYNAPKNGLVMAIQSPMATSLNQLTGTKGVEFDLRKFSWIGRGIYERKVMLVGKKSPFQSFEKLRTAKTRGKISCAQPGGTGYFEDVVIADTLKVPLDVIYGFGGSKEQVLAILRGDIDMLWGSYSSYVKLVEAGDASFILQGGENRDPKLPNIPTWREVAPSDKSKAILSTLDAMNETGRAFATTPGIPAGRLKFLREAFSKAMHDPDFVKKAKKAKMDLEYLSGEGMEALIKKSLDIEEEMKQYFINIITKTAG